MCAYDSSSTCCCFQFSLRGLLCCCSSTEQVQSGHKEPFSNWLSCLLAQRRRDLRELSVGWQRRHSIRSICSDTPSVVAQRASQFAGYCGLGGGGTRSELTSTLTSKRVSCTTVAVPAAGALPRLWLLKLAMIGSSTHPLRM